MQYKIRKTLVRGFAENGLQVERAESVEVAEVVLESIPAVREIFGTDLLYAIEIERIAQEAANPRAVRVFFNNIRAYAPYIGSNDTECGLATIPINKTHTLVAAGAERAVDFQNCKLIYTFLEVMKASKSTKDFHLFADRIQEFVDAKMESYAAQIASKGASRYAVFADALPNSDYSDVVVDVAKSAKTDAVFTTIADNLKKFKSLGFDRQEIVKIAENAKNAEQVLGILALAKEAAKLEAKAQAAKNASAAATDKLVAAIKHPSKQLVAPKAIAASESKVDLPLRANIERR